ASPRHLVPLVFVLGLALGWSLGFVHPAFAWLYLAGLGTYLALSTRFSVRAARSARDVSLIPILPIVFLTYHVAYGLGLLEGLVDFVILRRSGRRSMTELTRSGPVQASLDSPRQRSTTEESDVRASVR